MPRDTKYFFVDFSPFGFKNHVIFNFFADDEPILIILHVPSAREKQDYRQQSTRIMHSTILQ